MKKTDNKGERPQKDIQPEMVEKLASIGCTGDEIATVLGCCRDTLYARFSDSLKKGQSQAKIALRRMQWQAATSGNVTMQIWLGKNMLGQSNTQDSQSDRLGQQLIRDAQSNICLGNNFV